jgi:hypothetical protein
MTVEQHDVIDFAGIDIDGNAKLTISDHLPWTDPDAHLFHLQKKINGYLRFVESGEIYQSFPEMAGRRVLITVVLKFTIPPDAQWFFTKCETAITAAGFRFELKILPNPT